MQGRGSSARDDAIRHPEGGRLSVHLKGSLGSLLDIDIGVDRGVVPSQLASGEAAAS